MLILLAVLPILTVVVLMTAMNQSAQRAGLIGAVLTLVIAIFGFSLGESTHPGISTTLAIGGIAAEAIHTTLSIVWIIFPALCIYHWQEKTGGINTIRDTLTSISANKTVSMIVIAFFFGLFLEGAAGFGTPIAVAAPLLLSFGMSPIKAVVAVLFGHAMGVSFGAIGTPVLSQVATLGIAGIEISRWAAVLHVCVGWILLIFTLRSFPQPIQFSLGQRALAYGCFIVPFLGFAWFVGPELPTVAGALIGTVLFIVAIKLREPRDAAETTTGQSRHAVWVALSPYLLLVVLVLLTRTIPDLKAWLTSIAFTWEIAERFNGKFPALFHPGTLIFVSLLAGAVLSRKGFVPVGQAMRQSAKQVIGVMVALVCMLTIARTMVHAGMINLLAEYAAASTGQAWPIVAPFVGVLGSFVTGSATASNILFSEFQADIAASLALSTPLMLATQAFGAAIGNIVCPHNIIAGCATVGISGKEGVILRQTITACVIYSLAGGIIAFVISNYII